MTLNLNVPKIDTHLTPRITVIGVGGAGGNAVNNMIQSNLEGVDFLVSNTDSQALAQSMCDHRIQLGRNITQGLGAGSRPDIGRAAAEEALDDILGALEGVNMVFITAGMGGGTGTGAGPVIARAAREAGILTVGVITKPFHFEGVHRMRLAEAGLTELQQYVDTLIIIPNQNLFRVANEKTTFADAFKMADDVLYAGVRGVTDLMVMPGLINLDFADIRAVMTEMGKAMMGTGEADSENRAIAAAEAAISNPLLDEVSMKGARGVLINITGGMDLTLFEVDEAANRIRDEVDPDANIIFGSTFDQSLEGKMRVSVVATGIDVDESIQPRPVALSLVSDRAKARQAGAAQQAAGHQASDGDGALEAAAAAPTATAYSGQGFDSLANGGEDSDADDDASETTTATLQATDLATERPERAAAEADTAADGEEAGEDWEADSFIAPPPVVPEPKAQLRAERTLKADPYNAAAMANGVRERNSEAAASPGAGRARSPGFIAMVRGAARAMHSATQTAEDEQRLVDPAPAEPTRSAPTPAQPAATARPSEPRRDGAREAAPAGRQPSGQPRLTGLDATERAGAKPADDDLLDIPAFLRRTAN